MITDSIIVVNEQKLSVKFSGVGENFVLFLHGSCMDADSWATQLECKELAEKYKLIAFDLPGHGKSDRYSEFNSFNYRPPKLAELIQPILKSFNIKRFVLCGLSLGTNIIAEITKPIEGCTGILLGSVCIVNDQFPLTSILTPGPNGHVMVTANPGDHQLRDYMFSHAKTIEQAERYARAYRSTDPAFRLELGQTIIESGLTNELANIENWNVPVCVVYGREETLINTNYLKDWEPLWQNKIHYIEGAGHLINEDQPEDFNKLLLSFADEVFK